MTSAQRIALNTIATYVRTLVAIALGIFSGRWVFQALGEIDYGLMAVVGGLIVFVTFFNGVMASSNARFFALSIGRGDTEETTSWFNTALSVHTILPLLLITIGWFAGSWAVSNYLNIPLERLVTATWVFRLSLISALCSMMSAPFVGMFTAKQRIFESSMWSILGAILNFVLAFFLAKYRGDTWLFYSAGTVAILVFITLCQVARAYRIFPECKIHFYLWFDQVRLKQILSFSGWQLFGAFGSLIRGQGISVLLNKNFPPMNYPAVNASYSIGNTVSGYTQTLATALLGAFSPEITATEGRADRQRMLRLSNRASKFGVWLILLFAVPLLLEIDGVLILWLKTPPSMAALFCRIFIIQFLIERLSFGQQVAVNAVGKIAGYQMMLGGGLMATLPLAWLLIKMGRPATAVAWAIVTTTTFLTIGRVVWARALVGAKITVWVKDVLLPTLITLFISLLLGYGVQSIIDEFTVYRFFAVGVVTTTAWLMAGAMFVLDKQERTFFRSHVKKLFDKLTLGSKQRNEIA